MRGGGRRRDARQFGDVTGVALEVVQHRARLRIVDPHVAVRPPRHDPGLLAVRRYEAGQDIQLGAARALELAVQLAGLLVPHLDPPVGVPDKEPAKSRE
jgi:hypothetical protein